MTTEFVLGPLDAEHISITALCRERPGVDWVVCSISVAAGGFSGRVQATLLAGEIRSFNEDLKLLYRKLSGAAVLQSVEHWIQLSVRMLGSSGGVEIVGELRDRAGDGNLLRFELPPADQSYLPGWIAQLDEIEGAFPVTGQL